MANPPFHPALPSQEGGEFLARFRAQFGRDPTAAELQSGTLASMLHESLNAPLQVQQPTLDQAVASPSAPPTLQARLLAASSPTPVAPPHAPPASTAGRFPEFAEPPRYSQFGDPLNPAAQEEEAEAAGTRLVNAEPAAGTPIRTARTAALGYALGLGQGVLGLAKIPEQLLEAAGYAEEPNNIPTPALAPGAPPETPAAVELAKGLNPLPAARALFEMRDPEAVGSTVGMLAGGELFHDAAGVDAGNARRVADDVAEQRAADAVARQTPGPVPTAQETAMATPTYARRSPPVPRAPFTPPAGDLETPTFARRAVEGTLGSSSPGMTPIPQELLDRADELAAVVPREPTALETAGASAAVPQEMLDHADLLAQQPEASGVAGKIDHRLLATGGAAAVGGAIGAAATPGDTKDKLLGALAGATGAGLLGAAVSRPTEVPPAMLDRAEQLAEASRGPGVPTATDAVPATDAAEHLNLARMNLTPEAQAALEPKVLQAADELGVGGKPVRTFAEAEAHAKMLATDLPGLLKIPAARLTSEERLALRNVVTTDATRAVDLARALHDPSTPPDALDDLKAELSQINQRQQQILPKLVQSGTQQGRDLAYNRILAQQTTDPAFWLERATRVRGDEYPLSDAERAQVVGLAHAGNRQALADYVAKLKVPTWQEKLVGLGKTNLISALTTATKIGATNLLELGRSAVTAPMEQALDWLASGISGVRTRVGLGRNLVDVAQRAASGVKADIPQLARGETPAVGPQGGNLLMGNRELDYVSPNAGAVGKTLGGAANAYTHGVGRLHSILHRATWQPAYQAALFEQGRILAASEGLKGDALATRARTLADQPTGEMFQRAVDAANRATFLDKSGVSTWLQQFARSGLTEGGVGGNLKYFGTQAIVPFARISTNIVKAGAEYSPLGMAMSITNDVPKWIKAVRGGDPTEISAAQRQMIDRIGRAAPGTAAFVYGYLAYKNGTMTSTEPETAKERDLWKNQGMGPNAVKVGNGWRNVLVAGPLGLSAAMGAAYAQATAKAQTTGDKVSGATVGAVRAIAEESFLRGIEDFGNALHDPAGAGTAFLRNTISSWTTPNVVASVAKATDPSQLGRVAKTLPQSLQARVPGQREGLPPGLDAFGRPMLVKPTAGSVAKAVLDPSNPRANPSAGDPVLAEMTRVGVRPTYAKQGPKESQGDYLQRVAQQGAAYRRLATAVISGQFTEPNMPSYAQAQQIAQALVQQSPEFRGKDPAVVADELRAMALEHAFAGLRAAFTKGQPKAATTDRQLLNQMRRAK